MDEGEGHPRTHTASRSFMRSPTPRSTSRVSKSIRNFHSKLNWNADPMVVVRVRVRVRVYSPGPIRTMRGWLV